MESESVLNCLDPVVPAEPIRTLEKVLEDNQNLKLEHAALQEQLNGAVEELFHLHNILSKSSGGAVPVAVPVELLMYVHEGPGYKAKQIQNYVNSDTNRIIDLEQCTDDETDELLLLKEKAAQTSSEIRNNLTEVASCIGFTGDSEMSYAFNYDTFVGNINDEKVHDVPTDNSAHFSGGFVYYPPQKLMPVTLSDGTEGLAATGLNYSPNNTNVAPVKEAKKEKKSHKKVVFSREKNHSPKDKVALKESSVQTGPIGESIQASTFTIASNNRYLDKFAQLKLDFSKNISNNVNCTDKLFENISENEKTAEEKLSFLIKKNAALRTVLSAKTNSLNRIGNNNNAISVAEDNTGYKNIKISSYHDNYSNYAFIQEKQYIPRYAYSDRNPSTTIDNTSQAHFQQNACQIQFPNNDSQRLACNMNGNDNLQYSPLPETRNAKDFQSESTVPNQNNYVVSNEHIGKEFAHLPHNSNFVHSKAFSDFRGMNFEGNQSNSATDYCFSTDYDKSLGAEMKSYVMPLPHCTKKEHMNEIPKYSNVFVTENNVSNAIPQPCYINQNFPVSFPVDSKFFLVNSPGCSYSDHCKFCGAPIQKECLPIDVVCSERFRNYEANNYIIHEDYRNRQEIMQETRAKKLEPSSVDQKAKPHVCSSTIVSQVVDSFGNVGSANNQSRGVPSINVLKEDASGVNFQGRNGHSTPPVISGVFPEAFQQCNPTVHGDSTCLNQSNANYFHQQQPSPTTLYPCLPQKFSNFSYPISPQQLFFPSSPMKVISNIPVVTGKREPTCSLQGIESRLAKPISDFQRHGTDMTEVMFSGSAPKINASYRFTVPSDPHVGRCCKI